MTTFFDKLRAAVPASERIQIIHSPGDLAILRIRDASQTRDIRVRETEGVLFADNYAIHQGVNLNPYEVSSPYQVLNQILSTSIMEAERYGGNDFVGAFGSEFARQSAQYGTWYDPDVVRGQAGYAVYGKQRALATTATNIDDIRPGTPIPGGFAFLPKENQEGGRSRLVNMGELFSSIPGFTRTGEAWETNLPSAKWMKVSRLATNNVAMHPVNRAGTATFMPDPLLGGYGELTMTGIVGGAFPMPVGGAYMTRAHGSTPYGISSEKRYELTPEEIIAGALEPLTRLKSANIPRGRGGILGIFQGVTGEEEGPDFGQWKNMQLRNLNITLPKAWSGSDLFKRLNETIARLNISGSVSIGENVGVELSYVRSSPLARMPVQSKWGGFKANVTTSHVLGGTGVQQMYSMENVKWPGVAQMQLSSGILQHMGYLNAQKNPKEQFPVADIAKALGLPSAEIRSGPLGQQASQQIFDAVYRGQYSPALQPFQAQIESYKRRSGAGVRQTQFQPSTIGYIDTRGVNDPRVYAYLPRVMGESGSLDMQATIEAIQRQTGASASQAGTLASGLQEYLPVAKERGLPIDLTGNVRNMRIDPGTNRISSGFEVPMIVGPLNTTYRPTYGISAAGMSLQEAMILANTTPEIADRFLEGALTDPKGRQRSYWEAFYSNKNQAIGSPQQISTLDLAQLSTRAQKIMEAEGGTVMSPRWELMALQELQDELGGPEMLLTAGGGVIPSSRSILAQFADDKLSGLSVSRLPTTYMNVVKAHLPNSTPEAMQSAVSSALSIYRTSEQRFLYNEQGHLNPGIRQGMSTLFPPGKVGGPQFLVPALSFGEDLATEDLMREMYESYRAAGETREPFEEWRRQLDLGEYYGTGMRWPLMQPEQEGIRRIVSGAYLLNTGRISKEEYAALPKAGVGVSVAETVGSTSDLDNDLRALRGYMATLDPETSARLAETWEKQRYSNTYQFLSSRAFPGGAAAAVDPAVAMLGSSQSEAYKGMVDVSAFTRGNHVAALLQRLTPGANQSYSLQDLVDAQVAYTEGKGNMGRQYALPVEIPNMQINALPAGASTALTHAERKMLAAGLGAIEQNTVDFRPLSEQNWRGILNIVNSATLTPEGIISSSGDKWPTLAESLPNAVATVLAEASDVDPTKTLDLMFRQQRGVSLESTFREISKLPKEQMASKIAKDVFGWGADFSMPEWLSKTAFGDLLMGNRGFYMANQVTTAGHSINPEFMPLVNRWRDYKPAAAFYRGKAIGTFPNSSPAAMLQSAATLGLYGAGTLANLYSPINIQRQIPAINLPVEVQGRQILLDIAAQSLPANVRSGIAAGRKVFRSSEFGQEGWNAYPTPLSTRASTLDRSWLDTIASMALGWDTRSHFTKENALAGGLSPAEAQRMEETFGKDVFASPGSVYATTSGKVFHLAAQQWLDLMGAEFKGVLSSEEQLVAPTVGAHGTVDAALNVKNLRAAFEAASKEDQSGWSLERKRAFTVLSNFAQNPVVQWLEKEGVETINADIKTMWGDHSATAKRKKMGSIGGQMAEYRWMQAELLRQPGESIEDAMKRVATIIALDPTDKFPKLQDAIYSKVQAMAGDQSIDPNELPNRVLEELRKDDPNFMNDLLVSYMGSFRRMSTQVETAGSKNPIPELEYLFGKGDNPGAIAKMGAVQAAYERQFGHLRKGFSNEAYLAAMRRGEVPQLVANAARTIYGNQGVVDFVTSMSGNTPAIDRLAWRPRGNVVELTAKMYEELYGEAMPEQPTASAELVAQRTATEDAIKRGTATIPTKGGEGGGGRINYDEFKRLAHIAARQERLEREEWSTEQRREKAAQKLPVDAIPALMAQLAEHGEGLFGEGGQLREVAGRLAANKANRNLSPSLGRELLRSAKKTQRGAKSFSQNVSFIQDALEGHMAEARQTDSDLYASLQGHRDAATALGLLASSPENQAALSELTVGIPILTENTTPLTAAQARLLRQWPQERLEEVGRFARTRFNAAFQYGMAASNVASPLTLDEARQNLRNVNLYGRRLTSVTRDVEQGATAAELMALQERHLGRSGAPYDSIAQDLIDLSQFQNQGSRVVDTLKMKKEYLEDIIAGGSLPTKAEQAKAEKAAQQRDALATSRTTQSIDLSLQQYGGEHVDNFTKALANLKKELIATKDKGIDPLAESTQQLLRRSQQAAHAYRSWAADLEHIGQVAEAQEQIANEEYQRTGGADALGRAFNAATRSGNARAIAARLRTGADEYDAEAEAFQNRYEAAAVEAGGAPPPPPPSRGDRFRAWLDGTGNERRRAAGMFGGGLGALGFGLFNMERAYRWTFGALRSMGAEYAGVQQELAQAEFQAGGSLISTAAAETVRGQQVAPQYLRYRIGDVYSQRYGPGIVNLTNQLSDLSDQNIGRITDATAILGGLTMWQVGASSLASLTGVPQIGMLGGFQLPATLARGAYNLVTTGSATNAGAKAAREAWKNLNPGQTLPWVLPGAAAGGAAALGAGLVVAGTAAEVWAQGQMSSTAQAAGVSKEQADRASWLNLALGSIFPDMPGVTQAGADMISRNMYRSDLTSGKGRASQESMSKFGKDETPRGAIPIDNNEFVRLAVKNFNLTPDEAASLRKAGNTQKGKDVTWEEFADLARVFKATGSLDSSFGFWLETGRKLGAVPGSDVYWDFYRKGTTLPYVQQQQIDLAAGMVSNYGMAAGLTTSQMAERLWPTVTSLTAGTAPGVAQANIGRNLGFSPYAQAFGFPEGYAPATSLAQQMLGKSQTEEAASAWSVSVTDTLAKALGVTSVAGREALSQEFERRMGASWAVTGSPSSRGPQGPLSFLRGKWQTPGPQPKYGKTAEEVLGEMVSENLAGISLNLGIEDEAVARKVEERFLALKRQPRQQARYASALSSLRDQYPSLTDTQLEEAASGLEKHSLTEQKRLLDLAKQSDIPGYGAKERIKQAEGLLSLPGVTDQQRGMILQMRESTSPQAWSMAAWGGGSLRKYLGSNDPRRGAMSLSMSGGQVTGGWMPLVDAMGNDWFKYNTWNINGQQYGNTYKYDLNMANIEQDLGIAQGRYSIYQQQWQIRNIQREYGSLTFPQTQALYARRDKMSEELAQQGLPGDKIKAQVDQALPLNGVGLAQQEYMIRRQMWQESIAQQQASLNLQREMLALAIQEYRERRAYQIEEREATRGQTLLQRSWQRGDMLRSRSRFETQTAWSLEDMDRAIRFSSGRERIDLLRQRERFVVTSGWQRDDQTRSLRRQDQQWRFEDHRYEKAVQFERRMNELQEQRFRLQQKGLDLQQDALNKQIAAQTDLQKIEDKRFADTVAYNQGQVGHLQTILGLEAQRQREIEKWADAFKVMRTAETQVMLGLVKYMDAILAKLGISTGIGDIDINDYLPGGSKNPFQKSEHGVSGSKDPTGTTQKETAQIVVNLQVGTQVLGTVVQQLHRQMHTYDARF